MQPTEAEVRAAVELALPDGAIVDQMTFAVFSDDRSKGRVSVKGTHSFSHDIYSLPTPPVELMRSLASAQIFDTDVAQWWSENSSFYPQFKGELGEFQKLYSNGESLEFSGELPYLAVVDGTKIDVTRLALKPLEGTLAPEFGYLDDPTKVAELTAAVTEWRNRRRDEAAAAAAAKAAEAEAAAATARSQQLEREQQAAKLAAARAVEEAKAAEEIRLALMEPEVLPCKPDSWASQYPKCELVVFTPPEQIYQRTATSDQFCIYFIPINVTQVPKVPGVYEYVPGTDGRGSVEIFDLPLGEKFNGYTCGG